MTPTTDAANVAFRGLVVALALQLAVSRPASAQGRDPVAAEALFAEGREAMRAGDYGRACAKFVESQRLDPATGTLLNLAACERESHQLASSWQHYREALGQLAPGDDRVEEAERRVAELDARAPKLRVRLSADAPAGTTVTRDGVALNGASVGAELPFNPGRHSIVARAYGHVPRAFEIELGESERRELVVRPGPAEPAGRPGAAASLAPGEARNAGVRGAAWVLLGVGAAGLGVSLVAGSLALGKWRTVEDECPDKHCRDQDGVDAGKAGKALSTVSTAAFAAGALGVGAGAYLLLRSGPSTKGATALGAVPQRGGAGLTLTHSF